MHLLKHSLISFDKCRHLCTPYLSQVVEHFHYPKPEVCKLWLESHILLFGSLSVAPPQNIMVWASLIF